MSTDNLASKLLTQEFGQTRCEHLSAKIAVTDLERLHCGRHRFGIYCLDCGGTYSSNYEPVLIDEAPTESEKAE